MPGMPTSKSELHVDYINNQTTLRAMTNDMDKWQRLPDGSNLLQVQLISDMANHILTADQAALTLLQFEGQEATMLSTYTKAFSNLDQTPNWQDIKGKTIDQQNLQYQLDLPINYDGKSDPFLVSYIIPTEAADIKMAITYQTNDGTALPTDTFKTIDATMTGQTATKTITGADKQVFTDSNHMLIPKVPGYTANKSSVTFDKNKVDASGVQPVTVTYVKDGSTPVAPAAFQVYGKQKFYRYQHVDFKKNERIRKYATKPSAYAPVFTVVNTTQSKAGNPRYQLSDGSYITAKSAYVGKLFLEDETAKTLYVTNPKGIWTHTSTAFSDQLTHLKQGSKVAVTKLVKDGDTTRYQLADGTFVTGNQRYITTDKPQWVTRVKAVSGRNLYSDVDLTNRLKHYRKGHIFTVKGWDYSYGHNQLIPGTKRYKVAGGYITGNPKLVKIVK
ncbi:hypothetical protein IV54_GL000761 [Levilactobacillus paucivorans]|uniref:DUF5776 domain-containing protein n=2 Tax=Levilactobacillus paucivorans TaxID=616990 RepID=A0A0R2LTG8_9LACO|nr:hypothetical protein IV54_GL000761 [Levilactobacillus paucivorans]